MENHNKRLYTTPELNLILTDDPLTIEPILATCLITPDECILKVRPIGVGDVIRRIMANASLELQNKM